MQLLVDTIGSEMKMMLDNGIRLATIGDTQGLPKATREALAFGIEQTKNGRWHDPHPGPELQRKMGHCAC